MSSLPAKSRSVRHRDPVDPSLALPRYELRSTFHGLGDAELEVWQLPSPATPHLRQATRIAGLRGRNLEFIEGRVARRRIGGGAAAITSAQWQSQPVDPQSPSARSRRTISKVIC